MNAENFNRFKLGRALDDCHAYGCDLLFAEISAKICKAEGVDTKFNIADSKLYDAETIEEGLGSIPFITRIPGTLKLENTTISKAYKNQNNTVEKGFRFLKDPLMFTSSLFVKKPERIMGLLMVMTLALLVYAVAQRRLHKVLESR